MKPLFILSNMASLVLGYLFISNIKHSVDLGYLITMALVGILFFIFIILSILSSSKKPKSRSLFYNSYSDRRTKNAEFDNSYSFLNK